MLGQATTVIFGPRRWRDGGFHRLSHRPFRPVATQAVLPQQAEPVTTRQTSVAYPFPEIEAKWQAHWEEHQTFRTPAVVDTSKPKYYVLDMFPYPRWAPAVYQQGQADLTWL